VRRSGERTDAERPHGDTPHKVRAEGSFDLRLRDVVSEPPREEKAHRSCVEPPKSERERTRRRWIEPLHVVDRDQRRSSFAQELQRVAHCDCTRASIDGISGSLLT
jgi:hypothetical protein